MVPNGNVAGYLGAIGRKLHLALAGGAPADDSLLEFAPVSQDAGRLLEEIHGVDLKAGTCWAAGGLIGQPRLVGQSHERLSGRLQSIAKANDNSQGGPYGHDLWVSKTGFSNWRNPLATCLCSSRLD